MQSGLGAVPSEVALVAGLTRFDSRRDQHAHWDDFCEGLREHLRLSFAGVYGLSRLTGRVVATFAHTSGVPRARVKSLVDGVARSVGYRLFDPQTQANQVATTCQRKASVTSKASWKDFKESLETAVGFRAADQVRMLVTESRTLLGWVGVTREAYDRPLDTRQLASLRRLIPAVRQRLVIDEGLRRAPMVSATLDAALMLFDEPVILADETGAPILLNPVAQRLWDSDARLREQVATCVREGTGPFRTSEVVAEGLPRHVLLVHRGEADGVTSRLAQAVRDWTLTRREAEVLTRVIRGDTNQSIGGELGCAVRTIELHVTRLFEKSLSDNRATLIARFWTGERA